MDSLVRSSTGSLILLRYTSFSCWVFKEATTALISQPVHSNVERAFNGFTPREMRADFAVVFGWRCHCHCRRDGELIRWEHSSIAMILKRIVKKGFTRIPFKTRNEDCQKPERTSIVVLSSLVFEKLKDDTTHQLIVTYALSRVQ